MPARSPAISLDKFTTFGDLLKYLRRRAALTQIELAMAVSYSDTHISHLELNQRLPDLATVEARFVPALRLQDEPQAVARLLELAAAIRREDAPDPGLPPFKGLQYFDEADAGLFFGREALVAKIATRIGLPGSGPDTLCFLAVVGASGSGKSSIVRAGVIPSLRWIKSSAQWQIHVMTPTAHPLESLAASLTGQVGSIPANMRVVDQLAQGPGGLHAYLQRPFRTKPPAGDPSALLVVDQFEELFTLCRDEAERCVFIDNLMTAAAEPNLPTHVLVTLRADFYAQCSPYPTLRNAMALQQEYIGPLTAEELRRAIEEPARRGGWELEPGLVEILLQDVHGEPGALPLLLHALLETWQRRRGRTLTLSGYVASGGVRGAIAETAEAVFSDLLNPQQQAIARNIFVRLTELGEDNPLTDTRRRASFDELVQYPEQAVTVRTVLTILADARLITTDNGMAEVAHEALIREWPTLRYWLEEDRNGLRLHRRLTEAAQTWDQAGRDAGELYRQAKLAQALEWAEAHAPEMNGLEREFLAVSQAESAREATQREAQRQSELEAARQLADAEARRADAQAQAAQQQAQAARQLRRRAWFLWGALGIASLLALAAVVFGQQSDRNARRADVNAGTAQSASTVAVEGQAAALAAQATAVAERQQAEHDARLAQSRELAAAAVNRLTDDPEASILLALQSMAATSADGVVLPEANNALHRAVQSSHVRLTLSKGSAPTIFGVAFSPDGARLATASGDSLVSVWDTTTGQRLLTLVGHGYAVLGVAFSPDGTRLATTGDDGSARVWDIATSKVLLTLTGHGSVVTGVAYSPDGKRLATSSLDGTVKVWDAATGSALLTVDGQVPNEGLAFNADGSRLATAQVDGRAKVWDAATGKELLTLVGHLDTLWSITFSPDGQRIATASSDGTARVWDAATGQALLTLSGHTGCVYGVAFSPDGARLATVSGDQTAKVWDARTGQPLRTLAGHAALIRAVAFDPSGTRLATASADGTAKIWSAAGSATPTLSVPAEISATTFLALAATYAAFSPDGLLMATFGWDGALIVWDATTGRQLYTLPDREFDWFGLQNRPFEQYDVAFGADGRQMAAVIGGINGSMVVKRWEVSPRGAREVLAVALPIRALDISRTAFDPAWTRVATALQDGQVKVWDMATGQELLTLSGHTAAVTGVTFSPDGKRLATASGDSTVRVWDLATGKAVLTLSGQTGSMWSVAFNPDGTRLATAGNGTVRLWDALTGQLQLTPLQNSSADVYFVDFSPDGQRLATALQDGTAVLWNVATGQKLLTLAGHTEAVNTAVFSHDGTRLVTTSNDGTAKVWGLAPNAEGATWPGALAGLSPDGTRLATLGGNDTAVVTSWDVSTNLLVTAGVGRAPITFTLPISFSSIIASNLSRDGTRLATATFDGTSSAVKVWTLSSGGAEPILTLSGDAGANPDAPTLGPDGTRLVTVNMDSGIAKVWDVTGGRLLTTWSGYQSRGINSATFSPDGARLVTTSAGGVGTAWVWDTLIGKPLLTLSGHANSVFAAAFSPDGRLIATGSRDNTTRVWDADTGKLEFTLLGHTAPVVALAFSADGKVIATSSWDDTTKIWDATTGQLLQTIPTPAIRDDAVALSQDGTRLLAGSSDGYVQEYFLRTEDLVALAKTRVTRSLTTAECQQYLHAETCPGGP